ncbi:S1 RNA-binding domain-containing protein, partial [bacterium]|nr:S1 RNA-binding domain-containing protein [candidate division CSSED10-310 bacterium]
GDMDFKVTGTRSGVTAIQLDNKLGHLPRPILSQALEQARKGLNHILDRMDTICTGPRKELKSHAPRIEQFMIRENKIGLIIGPGGKTIKEIQAATDSTIDIAEDGRVRIFARNREQGQEARNRVEWLCREPRLNGFYRGVVKSIKPFGVFVEILPNTEGLVHVSDLDTSHVEDPNRIVRSGDTIPVKVIGVDNGRLKLSRKDALNISDLHFER